MARDVIDAVLGPDGGQGAPEPTPPTGAWSAPPTPARSARIAAELATIPAIAARRTGDGASRLVARHGTEAPGVVALGAELDLLRPLVPGGRSSRPRSPGPPATSSPCRSTTSWRAGRGSPRSCPDRGAAIAPRVAELLGAELGWGETRQAREVDAYLETARREYSVAASNGAGTRPQIS